MRKSSVVILAVVAALLMLAWRSGVLAILSQPAAMQATIAHAGIWAPLVFVALGMGMFAAFILAPLVWAATAVWPLPLAYMYSFGLTLFASVLTYGVSRRLGKDWAQDRVPAAIRRWEERLRTHPFSTIFVLRILLWANPLVDLFAAVSRVPTRMYLLATVIGLVPTTAFQILLGAGGITIAGHLSWWGWGLVVLGLLASGFGYRTFRARRILREPAA